ncbi:TolC family protein [candidate division KSB1 bacterium]
MIAERIGAFLIAILLLAVPGTFGQTEKVLTLKECLELARKTNPALAVAAGAEREAGSGVAGARTNFLPKVINQSTYTRLDIVPFIAFGDSDFQFPGMEGMDRIEIGDDDNYNVVFSATQPIFSGGRIRNGYKAALLQYEARGQNRDQAWLQVKFQTESQYLNLIKTRGTAEVARQSVDQMKSHLKDLESMYQVGLMAENDVLKSRVQLSNTELLRIQADNGVRYAQAALASTIGQPLGTAIVPGETLSEESTIPWSMKEIIDATQQSNPQIRAGELNVEAGRRMVSVEKGGLLPSLSVIGNYNFKRPNRRYQPEFYSSWDVNLAVRMNLFDWGETFNRISQARARLQQSEAGLEQLRDQLALQGTLAYYSLQEAKERIDVTGITREQAQENFRVTQAKFREGLVTNTELLDAQIALTQAQIQRIEALVNYQIARGNVEMLMGGAE